MNKLVFTAILLLFSCTVNGQISTDEPPVSFRRGVPDFERNERNQKIMPLLNMETIRREDERDKADAIPPRFGFNLRAGFNLNNSGE